jgi:NAD(P)-dependent dehydrogenase (short-subunit alcohol dehydrogenase family)
MRDVARALGLVVSGLQARATFAINYYGTVSVTEALLPLMADNTGRVVTVSSRAGLSSIIKDPKLRDRWGGFGSEFKRHPRYMRTCAAVLSSLRACQLHE